VQLCSAALPPAHHAYSSPAREGVGRHRAHRWFDLPNVPTMVELGYKDFIADTFQGSWRRPRRRRRSSKLLSTKTIEVLKIPKVAEQLQSGGFEVIANGPAGMRKRIDDEVPKWRDIVAKAGIKPV